MELKVKVHSLIDVITNSSTTVFITMNGGAVKGMFDIINEILRVAESDKKAEDLYSVEVDMDWDYLMERFIDGACDDPKDEKEKVLMDEYDAITDRKEQTNFENGVLLPYVKETGRWKDFSTNYDEVEYDTWLVVKPKNEDDKTSMDIWSKIKTLFSVEAYMDG